MLYVVACFKKIFTCTAPRHVTMAMEHKVLAGVLAIRLLAAWSPLHDLLQDDQQLASPLTAYSRCTHSLTDAKRVCH